MTVLLDGKALSQRLNKALKARVDALTGRPPGLAVVLVGEDAASQVYVGRKGAVAKRIGFHHVQRTLPESVPMDALLAEIDALNADPDIDGILVQLPLPRHLDATAVVDRIDPSKDVDGLTTLSTGLLAQGRPRRVACTPKGVMRLLAEAGVALKGARACVIGRSNIVGRPMAMLLEQANATVTVCHSRTPDTEAHVAAADVVVAAVGVPGLIRPEWVKPGAAVVDVGIIRMPDGRLVGDVDPAVEGTAGWLTPVPGGVGPMTIAMLMENTWEAFSERVGASSEG